MGMSNGLSTEEKKRAPATKIRPVVSRPIVSKAGIAFAAFLRRVNHELVAILGYGATGNLEALFTQQFAQAVIT